MDQDALPRAEPAQVFQGVGGGEEGDRERRRILEGENLAEQAHQMLVDVVTAYVDGATAEGYSEDWDLEQLWTALKQLYPVGIYHHDLMDSGAVGEAGSKTTVEGLNDPPPRGDTIKIEDDGSAAEKIVEYLSEQKIL